MIKNNRLNHNDPQWSHQERMAMKKLRRKERIATLPDPVQVPQWGSRNKDGTLTYKTMYKVRPIKTGKYVPKTEDEKHLREQLLTEVG